MRVHTPVRLTRAEQVRTVYFEVIPEGVSLEQALMADYWQHVRRFLRLYDIFELVAADGSFDAKARLTYINNVTGEMRFRLLSNVQAEAGAAQFVPAKSDRFEVKHRGHGTWGVFEKQTGNMVADGLSKEVAVETALKAESGRALQPA